LNHVELKQTGTELVYKYQMRLTGKNNYVCSLMMVNKEIEKRLGKDRAAATTEEFRHVLDNLEDLLQVLVRRVRKAKADYDEKHS
jgi:hypothetical protein